MVSNLIWGLILPHMEHPRTQIAPCVAPFGRTVSVLSRKIEFWTRTWRRIMELLLINIFNIYRYIHSVYI